MQSLWYADNPDLVKWSVLLRLAEENGCSDILQIAYLSRCSFGSLSMNGREIPLHPKVLDHFRNVLSIENAVAEPRISVFAQEIQGRADYVQRAIVFIKKFPAGKRVVFLDPDTGLEPAKPPLKHVLRHVLNTEAAQFWGILVPGDVLALYQHQTNRNGAPWLEEKRRQFASALGLSESKIGVGRAEKVARDVAFLFARKRPAPASDSL